MELLGKIISELYHIIQVKIILIGKMEQQMNIGFSNQEHMKYLESIDHSKK